MKILYTASLLSHICQFHLPVMEAFQQQGHEIHVAARDNLAEKNGLQLRFCDKYFNMPFQRSPKDKRNLDALKQLKKTINEEHYDIIICNTPVVGILTRIAAKKARKTGTKVVYIAHGFHFYKGAPKKYWLIYPIEKFFANRRTDLLITINHEDFERAQRKFKHCKVQHIYGVGVRSDRYKPATPEEQQLMREHEGLLKGDFVIICTKELRANSNQKTLLKATAILRDGIPNLKVLIAGNGPDDAILKQMTKDLGIEDNVRFLGYRTDLEKVVPSANVVVSCSYRDGMPLNIIEAMLSARPVVASHNRGHNELIEDGRTGFLFNADDADTLATSVMKIHNDPSMAEAFSKAAYEKVQAYTAESVVSCLLKIVEG